MTTVCQVDRIIHMLVTIGNAQTDINILGSASSLVGKIKTADETYKEFLMSQTRSEHAQFQHRNVNKICYFNSTNSATGKHCKD